MSWVVLKVVVARQNVRSKDLFFLVALSPNKVMLPNVPLSAISLFAISGHYISGH